MLKRCIAVLLIMALAVASAACGKSGNEKEPGQEQEQKKKSGFRRYTVERNMNGTVLSEKILTEEYEDLITEQTDRIYENGEVTELIRWYYDDSGEILLKKVSWHADPYYLTMSAEYDAKGRIIRFSQKREHEIAEGAEKEKMYFPEEYYPFIFDSGSFAINYTDFDAKEVKTEYTYKEGSDEIASIRTVTDTGETIALLERGDGEIILKQEYSLDSIRYKEAYDPATRKGTWEQHVKNYLDEDGQWNWLLNTTGEIEYDEAGRPVKRTEYAHNLIDGDMSSPSRVTRYSYTDDTKQVNTVSYMNDGTKAYCYNEWYDSKGHLIQTETENFQGMHYQATSTITYHENGTVATQSAKFYDSENGEYLSYGEEKLDTDGVSLWSIQYNSEGQPEQEFVTEYIQMQGIDGKVRKTSCYNYNDGEKELATENLYVCVKTPEGEDDWINYSYKNYGGVEKGKDAYKAEFDAEGHLIKVSLADGVDSYDYLLEYDAQGRPTHIMKHDADKPGIQEHFYEYWEGEAPQ